ncbi:MAG: AAA family ATPase [Patescibacteria group bacterium]|nr:AAA family ATPase [Patescibacteria group bacterium]
MNAILAPQPQPIHLVLAGPKVLLEGPSGTGKTYSLGTLVEWAAFHNIEVFVLFTENGLETLLGFWRDKGKPVPPNLHWHVAMTKPIALTSLIEAADKVGKLSYESITKMVDPNRGGDNNAFYKILSACSNFPDDRTGQKFGPIDQFTPSRIFVIDSLSELANAAMKMVIGSKPTASMPDYGVAQNNLMNFLRLCTQGLACTFVLTGHVDRLQDEITGGIKLMTKSIGKAMAGDIPQLFSDVIYAVREGTNFYWDTAAANVDVKTRSLPIQAKLPPDFSQIMNTWQTRKEH